MNQVSSMLLFCSLLADLASQDCIPSARRDCQSAGREIAGFTARQDVVVVIHGGRQGRA